MNTVRAAAVRVMPPAAETSAWSVSYHVAEDGGMNTVRVAAVRVMPPAAETSVCCVSYHVAEAAA